MFLQKNRYRTFVLGVAAAAIVLTVFRTIIMVDHMQINTVGIDYYLERNSAVTAFDIFVAAICAVFAFLSVKIGKKTERKLEFNTSAVVFTSSLVGFMMLSTGLYLCYRYFTANGVLDGADIIPIIITALSSGTFFYYSSKNVAPVSAKCAILGLAPIILSGARLIVDYAAQKDYPSSTINIYHILSLVALTLFFMNEGKFSIGKGSPAVYMLFGSLSVICLMIYALPSILLAAFWLIPLTDMVMFSALDMVLILYILTRMLSLCPKEES